jgi:hypothetical protein
MEEEAKVEPKARLQSRVNVDPETDCWHYTGTLVGNGYGHLNFQGELVYVHRLSAGVFLNFDLDSKLYVLHTCDQRDCINPAHLYVGTQKDNMRDAARKGRMVGKKLTLDKAIEIKRLLAEGETQRTISRKYDVSTTAIGQIARGETWKEAAAPTPSELRDAA